MDKKNAQNQVFVAVGFSWVQLAQKCVCLHAGADGR